MEGKRIRFEGTWIYTVVLRGKGAFPLQPTLQRLKKKKKITCKCTCSCLYMNICMEHTHIENSFFNDEKLKISEFE